MPASPCDWIPTDQVAVLVGPLDGAPERIRNVEQPKPSDDGNACLFRLQAQPRLGGRGVLLEVSPAAGVLYERTAGVMHEHFAAALSDGKPAAEPARHAAPDEGWDYTGRLPMGLVSYVGRIGHGSVLIVSQSPDVPHPSLAALAARVRDRIPDLPFLFLRPDVRGAEADGWRRARATAVGSRSLRAHHPLRGRGGARTTGGRALPLERRHPARRPLREACSFLTAGHRALVLRPHWEGGKMLFGMARNLGGTVASALPEAGPDHESADTLDGPWDEAAGNGTTGDLYFLKGDRMLEVGYLTSSTGPAGAVRLARIAVERL